MNGIKMLITDLDGTIADDKGKIAIENIELLEKLGDAGIIRTIATGRSFYLSKLILPDDFPIDYLIFSTGTGIIDWKAKEIIFGEHIKETEIKRAIKILKDEDVDFSIHLPSPENHKYFYHTTGNHNPDFHRRLEKNKDFGNKLCHDVPPAFASQFLIIFPPNFHADFEVLKSKLSFLSIIKTTSPLDFESVWMEIFPPNVSKGYTAEWLANKLNIKKIETVAIGNDYNDIELLNWAGNSFVVSNAPSDMKEKFTVVKSNNEGGFAEMVSKINLLYNCL